MRKLKIGDYVRYKNGKIEKIHSFVEQDNPLFNILINARYHNIDEIEKYGKTIDLIEVDDYVNGHKVVEVDLDDIDDYGNDFRYIKTEHDFTLNYWIKENEIETIVTHEQFESMKYRIGE